MVPEPVPKRDGNADSPFPPIFGHLGDILGHLGGIFRRLGRSWAALGRSWAAPGVPERSQNDAKIDPKINQDFEVFLNRFFVGF